MAYTIEQHLETIKSDLAQHYGFTQDIPQAWVEKIRQDFGKPQSDRAYDAMLTKIAAGKLPGTARKSRKGNPSDPFDMLNAMGQPVPNPFR